VPQAAEGRGKWRCAFSLPLCDWMRGAPERIQAKFFKAYIVENYYLKVKAPSPGRVRFGVDAEGQFIG
jgi:hypothetical protein